MADDHRAVSSLLTRCTSLRKLFREESERRRIALLSDPKHETYKRLLPLKLRKYGGRNLKKRKQTQFAVALAEAGYLNLLKWAHSQGIYFFHQKVCNAAARAGHLHILQYFDTLGKKHFRIDHTTLGAAAITDQMEIINWLRSKDCRFKLTALREAAFAGHLGVLEWARGISDPDDPAWIHTVIPAAAEGGHLHLLQWFDSQKIIDGTGWLMWGAARGGQEEVLEWLRANYLSNYTNDEAWDRWAKRLPPLAARGGQLSMLKKLVAPHGSTNVGAWRGSVTRSAAVGGNLDLLRWWESENSSLGEAGDFIEDIVASYAAQEGHLDVLEWLVRDLQYNSPSQLGTIAEGALRGHQLHVMKCLREKGVEMKCHADLACALRCPDEKRGEWMEWVRESQGTFSDLYTRIAASIGDLNVLEWLRECKSEFTPTVYAEPTRKGYLHVIKWLHQRGYPMEIQNYVIYAAVQNERLEILQWGVKNNLLSLRDTKGYYKWGSVKVLRWAQKNGASFDITEIGHASSNNNLKVLDWLKKNTPPWDAPIWDRVAMSSYPPVIEWGLAQPDCTWDRDYMAKHAATMYWPDLY